MFDRSYREAAADWKQRFAEWESGVHPARAAHPDEEYWDWDGMPPDQEYSRDRDWTPEEATHYQVYETVSEGTPVTPHFATKAELVDYLVAHGDFWDQARGHGGWSRENATQFVERAYAMSLVVHTSASGVQVLSPRDGA